MPRGLFWHLLAESGIQSRRRALQSFVLKIALIRKICECSSQMKFVLRWWECLDLQGEFFCLSGPSAIIEVLQSKDSLD